MDSGVGGALSGVKELQGVGEAAGLVYGLEALFDELFGFVELQVERGGFDVASADEAPFAIRHAFDEAALDVILGFKLGDESADVAIVILTVFVEEDGGLGVDAVFDGVGGGTEFSFGGNGSGGAERIAAVGHELYF